METHKKKKKKSNKPHGIFWPKNIEKVCFQSMAAT